MSERSFNKFITAKQNSFKEKAEDNITSGLEDEFNLNSFYLSEIGYTMSEWRLLNLYGIEGSTMNPAYFDRAVKILDALLDLLSPKISSAEDSDYDIRIRQINVNSKGIFKVVEDRTLMDRDKYDNVVHNIRSLYRELLRKLQEKGMLTKVSADPKLAMGDMS